MAMNPIHLILMYGCAFQSFVISSNIEEKESPIDGPCVNFGDKPIMQNFTYYESNAACNISDESVSHCQIGDPRYLYSSSLESINVIKIRDEWFATLSYYVPMMQSSIITGNEATFIMRLSIQNGNFWTCYSGFIPYSAMLQFKDVFTIPCVKILGHLSNSISIHSYSFYKEVDVTKLVHSQEIMYFNTDVPFKQKFQKILNPSYYFTSDTLHIKIQNSADYGCSFQYNISIHESFADKICDLSTTPMHQWHVNASNTETELIVNCSTQGFKSCKKYCIAVQMMVSDETCEAFHVKRVTDVAFLQVPPDDLTYLFKENKEIDCADWNATIIVVPNSEESSVKVTFTLLPQYEHCFDGYILSLLKVTKDCHLGERVQFTELAAPLYQTAVKTFAHLKPNNYCAQAVPYFRPCDYYDLVECIAGFSVHSNTIPLFNTISHVSEISTVIPSNQSKILIPLMIVCVIILLALIGGLYWYIKRYRNARNHTDVMSNTTDIASIEEDRNNLLPKKVDVVILYTHDERTKRLVEVLKDFLQKCPYMNVIIDEDHIEIDIDPESWLRNILDLNAGDGHTNKKIIIVESEQAVQYQTSKSGDVIESLEEKLFINGLFAITSDLKHSLKDYCHLFVVNFGEYSSARNGLKDAVPRDHYSIPGNLIALCLNLISPGELQIAEVRDTLMELFRSHPISELEC